MGYKMSINNKYDLMEGLKRTADKLEIELMDSEGVDSARIAKEYINVLSEIKANSGEEKEGSAYLKLMETRNKKAS